MQHPFSNKYNRIARGDSVRGQKDKPQGPIIYKQLAHILDKSAIQTARQTAAQTPAAHEHTKTLKEIIGKKEGMFRSNISGKRVHNNARSNTAGDPRLGHGQIGIPRCLALKMMVEEPVNDWSIVHIGASCARNGDLMRVIGEHKDTRMKSVLDDLKPGMSVPPASPSITRKSQQGGLGRHAPLPGAIAHRRAITSICPFRKCIVLDVGS